jgi:hypothetical protein
MRLLGVASEKQNIQVKTPRKNSHAVTTANSPFISMRYVHGIAYASWCGGLVQSAKPTPD